MAKMAEGSELPFGGCNHSGGFESGDYGADIFDSYGDYGDDDLSFDDYHDDLDPFCPCDSCESWRMGDRDDQEDHAIATLELSMAIARHELFRERKGEEDKPPPSHLFDQGVVFVRSGESVSLLGGWRSHDTLVHLNEFPDSGWNDLEREDQTDAYGYQARGSVTRVESDTEGLPLRVNRKDNLPGGDLYEYRCSGQAEHTRHILRCRASQCWKSNRRARKNWARHLKWRRCPTSKVFGLWVRDEQEAAIEAAEREFRQFQIEDHRQAEAELREEAAYTAMYAEVRGYLFSEEEAA